MRSMKLEPCRCQREMAKCACGHRVKDHVISETGTPVCPVYGRMGACMKCDCRAFAGTLRADWTPLWAARSVRPAARLGQRQAAMLVMLRDQGPATWKELRHAGIPVNAIDGLTLTSRGYPSLVKFTDEAPQRLYLAAPLHQVALDAFLAALDGGVAMDWEELDKALPRQWWFTSVVADHALNAGLVFCAGGRWRLVDPEDCRANAQPWARRLAVSRTPGWAAVSDPGTAP